MRLAAIGMGQCGGRILDLLYSYTNETRHSHVLPIHLAINTAKADLTGLSHISREDRFLIGQIQVRGHGVGLDSELGAKIVQEEMNNIKREITRRGFPAADAFLILAGLGGGTGSGGAPVLARHLKEIFEVPIYALGVLPSESEGKLMATNAARSIKAIQDSVDALLIFDNNIWQAQSVEIAESYTRMNWEVVKPLLIALGAGEAQASRVGMKVVDASDIIKSLMGISVFGHSSWEKPIKQTLRDILPSILGVKKTSIDQLDASTRCYSLIQSAAAGKLSAEVDLKTVKKLLMVVAGSPSELNREGIDRGRAWLEELTGAEVRGGDYPIPRWMGIECAVVFSGLSTLPGLERVFMRYEEFRRTRERKEEEKKELL